MEYRTLGKTGMNVSVVGIETHQWSGMGGRFFTSAAVRAIARRAEKVGINFIDTGECYFFHAAERLVGEALGKNRKQWIIATKFGHVSKPGEVVPAWTAEDIRKQLDDSLAALQTDYIDVYQAHLNTKKDIALFRKNMLPIRTLLREAKNEGKIRAIGICLGDDVLIGADGVLLREAVATMGVEVVQVVYNRLDKNAEKRIFPIAHTHRLGVIARVPLAKGYLSTRFRPTNKSYDPRRLAAVARIKKDEVPVGTDMSEWAIAWCLNQPLVSSVVPGCSAPEHIDSTVRASTIRV